MINNGKRHYQRSRSHMLTFNKTGWKTLNWLFMYNTEIHGDWVDDWWRLLSEILFLFNFFGVFYLQETNPYACLVFYWEPLNRQVRARRHTHTVTFYIVSVDCYFIFWELIWIYLNLCFCRSVLRVTWSGSPTRAPVITSTPDLRAARSGPSWADKALPSPTET